MRAYARQCVSYRGRREPGLYRNELQKPGCIEWNLIINCSLTFSVRACACARRSRRPPAGHQNDVKSVNRSDRSNAPNGILLPNKYAPAPPQLTGGNQFLARAWLLQLFGNVRRADAILYWFCFCIAARNMQCADSKICSDGPSLLCSSPWVGWESGVCSSSPSMLGRCDLILHIFVPSCCLCWCWCWFCCSPFTSSRLRRRGGPTGPGRSPSMHD